MMVSQMPFGCLATRGVAMYIGGGAVVLILIIVVVVLLLRRR